MRLSVLKKRVIYIQRGSSQHYYSSWKTETTNWGLKIHKLRYKHMLKYFVTTKKKKKRNKLDAYLIACGMIIQSSLRKFLEDKNRNAT